MEELGRFDPHGSLCTTPLLLNLVLSEYLRHEATDSAIQFDGVAPVLPPALFLSLLAQQGSSAHQAVIFKHAVP